MARISTPDRFFRYVAHAEADQCWLWTGGVGGHGYGQFSVGKTASVHHGVLAHRWVYEYFVAPIPDGLQLDHLCRVRRCVNPWHLEPVTAAVNMRRGLVARGLALCCSNDHEYTPDNTRISVDRRGRPYRTCRACERARDARGRAVRQRRNP